MMENVLIEVDPVVAVALEVIAGKYGNGEERRKALEKEGYDYSKIQSCVNDLIEIRERYGG